MKYILVRKLFSLHLILSILLVQGLRIDTEDKAGIRERRDAPTDLTRRVDAFLGTQRGQIILAVVLGVSGYLCCVIVPCCLGAASILLLHCMNLLEYPDTPTLNKGRLDLDKVHRKREQGECTARETGIPENQRECTAIQDSLADHPGPPIIFNQVASSEQVNCPVNSQILYPYLPYQFTYLTYGAHATNSPVYMNPATCNLPNDNMDPVSSNVRDEKAEVVYENY